jgi:hypothetical protein
MIREELRRLAPHTSLICLTSTLSPSLLSVLAEARSKKQRVHIYYVHEQQSLSHEEREALQQLLTLGCSWVAVAHEQRSWHKACHVLNVTREHVSPILLEITQEQQDVHSLTQSEAHMRGGDADVHIRIS